MTHYKSRTVTTKIDGRPVSFAIEDNGIEGAPVKFTFCDGRTADQIYISIVSGDGDKCILIPRDSFVLLSEFIRECYP